MSAALLLFPNISLKTLFFFLISLWLLTNINVSAHHFHSGCDCTLLELMDLPVRDIQANTVMNITQVRRNVDDLYINVFEEELSEIFQVYSRRSDNEETILDFGSCL